MTTRSLEFKATEVAGTGRARVTALNTVHRDGDVVRPGSLRNKWATVSPRDHETFRGIEPPVGFATLHEEDGFLWADITFHEGEACEFSRARGWSVGYVVDESHRPTGEELAKFGPRLERVITAWRIIEVTPVSDGKVPASPDTGSEEVCCGGACTVGGKSCCAECAQREAVLKELARFEVLRFQSITQHIEQTNRELAERDRPKHWSAIAEECEVPVWQVHHERRRATAKGVALALSALDSEAEPPQLHWFRHDTPVEAWGFSSKGAPVWVRDGLDLPECAAVAAHEVAHHLGHDEAAAERVAALVRDVFVSGRKLYAGAPGPRSTNDPFGRPGDITVGPDLKGWRRRDALNWELV